MLGRYDAAQAARVECEFARKYDTAQNARVDCEFARAYDKTQAAWVEHLKKSMEFAYVYGTGATPDYEYEPSADGTTAQYKSIVAADDTRTDLVLRIEAPATSAQNYEISFILFDVEYTTMPTAAGITVSYINALGEIVSVESFSELTPKMYEATIQASNDVAYIALVLQAYGDTGDYHEGTLSSLTINGKTYGFA